MKYRNICCPNQSNSEIETDEEIIIEDVSVLEITNDKSEKKSLLSKWGGTLGAIATSTAGALLISSLSSSNDKKGKNNVLNDIPQEGLLPKGFLIDKKHKHKLDGIDFILDGLFLMDGTIGPILVIDKINLDLYDYYKLIDQWRVSVLSKINGKKVNTLNDFYYALSANVEKGERVVDLKFTDDLNAGVSTVNVKGYIVDA